MHVPLAAVSALLLIAYSFAEVAQRQCDGPPQLRFAAQLSVNGCALFVHDTGANDGPHLAVEPIMCVTEKLLHIAPRYDPVTQQTYVSVPVMLRDDAMLAEVQLQLRHLSPKSVKFATVLDISVSTDNSSKIRALGFIWSPESTVGFLDLGCRQCSGCDLVSRIRRSQLEALNEGIMSVKYSNILQLKYRLTVQNRTSFDAEINFAKFNCLPECQQLRFVRWIRFINCTARVHQRLDMKGHFLIEPLLCHNITSMTNESIMYSYSRDMYFLKLDVVLQDDMAVDAVRTQLADLSPRSVAFMRLWRAQSRVASALSRRFEVGPLMVSGDWRSAQLRVFCRTRDECTDLRLKVEAEPFHLWKHVRYSLTSLVSDRCILRSDVSKHPWKMQGSGMAGDANCSSRFSADALIGRYHRINGSDCVSKPFRRWHRPSDLQSCGSVCDVDPNCQAFSINEDWHCELFVFNVCSNYVRERECSRRSTIYIKQQPGLPPGALCPAGFKHDYRGTKYMRLKDSSIRWAHYKDRCRSTPGLVAMADAVTRDIMNHLYSVFRQDYEDRTIPWYPADFPAGHHRMAVALDTRQLGTADRSEPAGGWHWETCHVPLDRSVWARGEPNDHTPSLPGIEDFGYIDPWGGINDGPPEFAFAGAFCKCVSPFD